MLYDIIVLLWLSPEKLITMEAGFFYPEQYNIFERTSVAKYSIYTEPYTHTKNSNY